MLEGGIFLQIDYVFERPIAGVTFQQLDLLADRLHNDAGVLFHESSKCGSDQCHISIVCKAPGVADPYLVNLIFWTRSVRERVIIFDAGDGWNQVSLG